jgi:hypothetical protein
MSRVFCWALASLVGLAVSGLASAARAADDQPASGRLFEMRTYIANDGKLADLHKRFREHTNGLFEKHGMTLIGYWTPVDGPEAANTLVYILAYPNREAREKSWKAFQADPDWQAARKASEVNGSLVKKVIQQFLTPTDYSPIK